MTAAMASGHALLTSAANLDSALAFLAFADAKLAVMNCTLGIALSNLTTSLCVMATSATCDLSSSSTSASARSDPFNCAAKCDLTMCLSAVYDSALTSFHLEASAAAAASSF